MRHVKFMKFGRMQRAKGRQDKPFVVGRAYLHDKYAIRRTEHDKTPLPKRSTRRSAEAVAGELRV